MRFGIKASILGGTVSLGVLALIFGLAPVFGSSRAADPDRKLPARVRPAPVLSGQALKGRSLFERNCAHCHGGDARGDEGPSLYNLALSDNRIARRIQEGFKGEMPRFGSKLDRVDVAALIAYMRTLKD